MYVLNVVVVVVVDEENWLFVIDVELIEEEIEFVVVVGVVVVVELSRVFRFLSWIKYSFLSNAFVCKTVNWFNVDVLIKVFSFNISLILSEKKTF